MKQTRIVIVPGRGNSESGHWQSIFETIFPGTLRVSQDDWYDLSLDAWSRNIDRVVRSLDHRPLVVAHSFGCLAAAHAQLALGTPVAATLFVAPADPERFDLPRGFLAAPLEQPGLVIASENDPWLTLEKAIEMAGDWGIDYLNIGSVGHINVASGHGPWPFGEAIVESTRQQLANGHKPTFHPNRQQPRHPALHGRRHEAC